MKFSTYVIFFLLFGLMPDLILFTGDLVNFVSAEADPYRDELDPPPTNGETADWLKQQTARIQEAVAALAPLVEKQ